MRDLLFTFIFNKKLFKGLIKKFFILLYHSLSLLLFDLNYKI